MPECPSSASLRQRLAAVNRPVALVGLMGAGKSRVGRGLAQFLDLPFSDADREIEAAAGCSIPEIFERFGEDGFRDGERRVLQRLVTEAPLQVLATGGGAFMNDTTRRLLLARTVTVWLRAELDTLVKRTAKRGGRPLLEGGDPRAILADLMAQRDPVYAQAHLTVDSHDGPPEDTVNAVAAALDSFLAAGRLGAAPQPDQADAAAASGDPR